LGFLLYNYMNMTLREHDSTLIDWPRTGSFRFEFDHEYRFRNSFLVLSKPESRKSENGTKYCIYIQLDVPRERQSEQSEQSAVIMRVVRLPIP